MYVLFVSACEKRAIKKANAVLDSYAVRIGERTWGSPITAEALTEVHTALRQVATRQMAVACFQNDGRRRMKPLWIVGSHSAFGSDGQFPVGRTRRQQTHIPPPRWVRCACLLAQAAGLAHDWGKYSQYFQVKLRTPRYLRDDIRHEWLSVRLLQHLRAGLDWETAWASDCNAVQELVLGQRCFSKKATYGPICAQEAIDSLVATHHLLFNDAIGTAAKTSLLHAALSLKQSHVRFERETQLSPSVCTPYSPLYPDLYETYAKLERKIEMLTVSQQNPERTLFWRGVLVYARAALIFADHTVSAVKRTPLATTTAACANTCIGETGERMLNQRLDWHLRTVAEVAASTVWHMTQMVCQTRETCTALSSRPEPFHVENALLTQARQPPQRDVFPQSDALKHSVFQKQNALEGLQDPSLSTILTPADEISRFQWQNSAAGALRNIREQFPHLPCLVFNMAGTGSGKTRMNLRAVCLLSRTATPRCSIALNLRSLTLQTGEALKHSFNLAADDIATVIGSHTVQRLFERSNGVFADDDENTQEPAFTCHGAVWPLPAWMEPFFRTAQERTLMGVPLLVSTIDFLGAAGTPYAQGHHVKALLRLMSADLVLDEIDGYEPEALVAVLRLVQLCAFFQRTVICSSATLSLPTALAIDAAYRSGIAMLHAIETESDEAQKATEPAFIRAIIDDALPPYLDTPSCEGNNFKHLYTERLHHLSEHLHHTVCLRRAFLQKVEASYDGFLDAVVHAVQRLHDANALPCSGNRISFGLVRMATITGAVDVARHIARTLPHAQVACYHSGDWLISRFYKERRLDYLLSRKDGVTHITEDAEIKKLAQQALDVPFIVVATPVEEIGRDHDFDWAVIEPSSAQSIVQTAGRVNRHRLVPCLQDCNVALLQYNLRHCKNMEEGNPEKVAFVHPGYEQSLNRAAYGEHDLYDLLPWLEPFQDEKALEEQDQKELVITAALRFDPACKLAQADDKAILRRTAMYFGSTDEQGEGVFVRNPVDSFLMSATPYKNTPLREQSTQKQLWRMQVENGYPLYSRLDEVKTGYTTKQVWVENTREMSFVDAAPNAWLSLTPQAMVELCHTMDIAPEDGLLAELTTYGENPAFEYDLGFGIKRT